MARGTRVQPGWNGSQTTTDRGAPNNSSAITAKYTPFVNPLWVSERLFCFSGLSERVAFSHTSEKRGDPTHNAPVPLYGHHLPLIESRTDSRPTAYASKLLRRDSVRASFPAEDALCRYVCDKGAPVLLPRSRLPVELRCSVTPPSPQGANGPQPRPQSASRTDVRG